jgi:hypothetical protein
MVLEMHKGLGSFFPHYAGKKSEFIPAISKCGIKILVFPHIGCLIWPAFSAQMWPSAWAKKSLDPAKSWPILAQAKKSGPASEPGPGDKSGPGENSGPGQNSCSAEKLIKNENNGPGIKLIEAKT